MIDAKSVNMVDAGQYTVRREDGYADGTTMTARDAAHDGTEHSLQAERYKRGWAHPATNFATKFDRAYA